MKGKKYFERACYKNDLYKDPNPSEVYNFLDTGKSTFGHYDNK